MKKLKEAKKQKVLILGFSTSSFLSVIRSLGRANIQVHVAWYKKDSLALSSKYIYKAHAIPPYSKDNDDWKKALIGLMKNEEFDLVIPCHDEMVFPLQRHRAELEKYGPVYTILDNCFEVLFNKIKTNQLARELNVRVPKEVIIEKPDTDLALAGLASAGLNFPLVLKPHCSYSDLGSPSRVLVKMVLTEEDFCQHLNSMLTFGPVIVQEYFSGKGVGVNFLLNEGEPLLVFQQERVHEPLRGGSGTYRKSTAVSPELLEAAVKIFSHLKYTGVAMAEFKVNPDTGQWVFLEVNARFWGSLPLALSAGADFPLALFELLNEGRIKARPKYREDIYCRNLTLDIAWQIKNLKADHRDATLLTIPVHQVLLREITNIFTFKERIDTWAFDDPKPFFAEIKTILNMVMDKITKKVQMKILEQPFICDLQRKKLIRKAKRAKSVLFLCHGNVCRSPFAEHLLKKQTVDINIESGGFFLEQGRIPPEEALVTALEYGIDLSKHYSKTINTKMVSSADMIFVFDYDNYRQFLQEYKQVKDKVFFVGVLQEEKPLFISDPWGKGLNYYQNIYERIYKALLRFTDINKPL